MKPLKILLLGGMCTLLLSLYTGAGEKKKAETKKALITVSGMTCGGCASEVKRALTKVDGVQDAKVSWKEGKAEVEFDANKTDAENLVKSIKKTGFQAELANVMTFKEVEEEKISGVTKTEMKAERKNILLNKTTVYACNKCGMEQAEAGFCPHCKSKLEEKTSYSTYACMHCGHLQAQAGKCPSCGMELKEYKLQEAK